MRNCAEKAVGIWVLRISQHFLRRAGFHDVPGIHNRDPVGEFSNYRQVMSDVQDSHSSALLHVLNQLQNTCLNCHVQCSGWLIGY